MSESRWHERVTQQPELQKSRRDVSNAAAAQSSPIHRALGQVRTKGLLKYCIFVYLPPFLAAATFTYCMHRQQLFSGLTKLSFLGFDRLFLRFYFHQWFHPLLHKDLPSCRVLLLAPHQSLHNPQVLHTIHRTPWKSLHSCCRRLKVSSARLLHKQLTSFIIHDQYFPFCLFRFRWKRF